jgi:hypothetical protein
LKGFKRGTIEKIPKPLRHRTYSSKKQPEIGKTRDQLTIKFSHAVSNSFSWSKT